MYSQMMTTAEGAHPVVYTNTKSGIGENVGGAWLIALLVLIVVALFYGINNRERKADERRLADNLFALNQQVGINSKGVSDAQVQIMKNENVLTGLTQDYSFRIGTLGAQTSYNTNAINQLGSYTCNPSCHSGCGVRGGRPEFLKRATYVQETAPTVIEQEACGNAFA